MTISGSMKTDIPTDAIKSFSFSSARPSSPRTAGNSHIDARSPRSGRCLTRTDLFLRHTNTAYCSSVCFLEARRTGKTFSIPAALASQKSAKGQSEHRGYWGMQITAPNSISASLKSPALPVGICDSTSRVTSFFTFVDKIFSLILYNLARTRKTLPSTAATGRL